jgi:hypothetical protein
MDQDSIRRPVGAVAPMAVVLLVAATRPVA